MAPCDGRPPDTLRPSSRPHRTASANRARPGRTAPTALAADRTPPPPAGDRPGADAAPAGPTAPAADQPPPGLGAVERDHILAVLRQTNWLLTGPRGAAKGLGLHANTLRNRMRRLGITRPAH